MKTTGVTIQDIARQAGVGVGTVSRVLNDSPNVTADTRQLVQQVIAQVGYRPKSAAKILRTRKTHEIGFITDEIATTPYAVDVIRGAQDAAWAQSKILVLINTNRDAQVLETAIEIMLDRQVEGLIYAAMYHQQVQLPANIDELPAVLVDCFTEDRHLPSVVPDEVQGGRDATIALLQKGHRRIGFLNSSDPIPASIGRLTGYQQALASYGVPFDPSLVMAQDAMPQYGYAASKVLLQQADPPTALFCFNDRTAMGVYDALRELGLRIPADVAVVGFDNQEIIAAHLRPALTSVQLPHYDMGRWAIQYLLATSEKPGSQAGQSAVQHICECPLIERFSI